MEKYELKAIIIELREENKTFSEISDILKNVYGITMSRQAINGMYKRAVSKNEKNRSIKMLAVITDVANFYCLGLTLMEIKSKIKEEQNISLSGYKIQSIIEEKKKYIDSIVNMQVLKITQYIEREVNIGSIEQVLQYKNEIPTKKVMKELMNKAAAELIRIKAVEVATKVINIMDNTDVIKTLNKRYNLNISLRELGIQER